MLQGVFRQSPVLLASGSHLNTVKMWKAQIQRMLGASVKRKGEQKRPSAWRVWLWCSWYAKALVNHFQRAEISRISQTWNLFQRDFEVVLVLSQISAQLTNVPQPGQPQESLPITFTSLLSRWPLHFRVRTSAMPGLWVDVLSSNTHAMPDGCLCGTLWLSVQVALLMIAIVVKPSIWIPSLRFRSPWKISSCVTVSLSLVTSLSRETPVDGCFGRRAKWSSLSSSIK